MVVRGLGSRAGDGRWCPCTALPLGALATVGETVEPGDRCGGRTSKGSWGGRRHDIRAATGAEQVTQRKRDLASPSREPLLHSWDTSGFAPASDADKWLPPAAFFWSFFCKQNPVGLHGFAGLRLWTQPSQGRERHQPPLPETHFSPHLQPVPLSWRDGEMSVRSLSLGRPGTVAADGFSIS